MEVNINGGLITVANSNTSSQYCIYNANSYANINITDGQLKIERINDDEHTYGSATIYGIANQGTITINSGNNSTPILIKNDSGSAYGTYGTTTLESGNIVVSSKNSSATGIRGKATVNNGTITVITKSSSSAIGIQGPATVTAGTITATGDSGAAYGIQGDDCSNGSLNVSGGTITANSTGANAYGVRSVNGWSGWNACTARTTISGGIIEGYSMSKDGYGFTAAGGYTYSNITGGTISGSTYGAYTYNSEITGGKITGGTYGVYTYDANYTTTIGDNDEDISITKPEITGGQYGLYNGYVNFYDGILRGQTAANRRRRLRDALLGRGVYGS